MGQIKLSRINRKAQLTVFIIIAIVILLAIASIFFFFRDKIPILSGSINADSYMQKCVSEGLEETEKKVLEGNGYLNLSDNFMVYYSEKIPYLCKATEFYVPCVNQEPNFIGYIDAEFEKVMQDKTRSCFSELKATMEGKGYKVNLKNLKSEINIEKRGVKEAINIDLEITKNEEKQKYNSFEVTIASPLFDLAWTTEKIVNYESTLCGFNSLNWMKFYPLIKIQKFVTSDSTKVYTLTDYDSEKKLKFAVRSCVLPAGI